MRTLEYNIVYSDRKTVSLTVKDARLTVRAPRGVTKKRLDLIVKNNIAWIEKKLEESKRKTERENALTEKQITELKALGKEYFTRRTEEISRITGLKYASVRITSAKTRFGSCSSRGSICFSYRLMLYPEAAREYVILHELAHTVEMNHSKSFYKIIEKFMPDYKARKRLLK